MAEVPPNQALAQFEDDFRFADSDTSSSSCDDLDAFERRHKHRCTALTLSENIAAYCERRKLERSVEAEPVACDPSLVENVVCNYIIAKKILSNLSWQDRMVCKAVCSTWRSAINALSKEQLYPVDFVFDLNDEPDEDRYIVKSDEPNEPLAVVTFTNHTGFELALDCSDMQPQLCKTPCHNKSHSVLDVIRHVMAKPKKCMLAISTPNVVYMPLAESPTSGYTLHRLIEESEPFIGGIHIPIIPGVQFHVLTIQQKNRVINMQNDFFDVLEKLAPDNVFKGMLVFVTEKYILQSVEELAFLNYLKDLQPDIPYALAGCIVEDTLYDDSNYELLVDCIDKGSDYNCEDIISIGLFTVPKEQENKPDNHNFEMFSLVIESTHRTRPKIQQIVNEFASKVPKFEHSVAFKLSCTGRDYKHKFEQEVFRAAFPDTPLVGCYGNGELGLDHPECTAKNNQEHLRKRIRRDSSTPGIMFSYSTVFMYIGWGRVIDLTTKVQTSKASTSNAKV